MINQKQSISCVKWYSVVEKMNQEGEVLGMVELEILKRAFRNGL